MQVFRHLSIKFLLKTPLIYRWMDLKQEGETYGRVSTLVFSTGIFSCVFDSDHFQEDTVTVWSHRPWPMLSVTHQWSLSVQLVFILCMLTCGCVWMCEPVYRYLIYWAASILGTYKSTFYVLLNSMQSFYRTSQPQDGWLVFQKQNCWKWCR